MNVSRIIADDDDTMAKLEPAATESIIKSYHVTINIYG